MNSLTAVAGCAVMLLTTRPCVADIGNVSLEFTVIQVVGQYAPKEPHYLLFRDSKKWNQFMKAWQLERPGIDFDKFWVIVAAPGEKPSSGYSVIISQAVNTHVAGPEGQRSVTIVSILDVGPGSCPIITEVGAPSAVFALIPKTNAPVSFRVHKLGANCSGAGSRDQQFEPPGEG